MGASFGETWTRPPMFRSNGRIIYTALALATLFITTLVFLDHPEHGTFGSKAVASSSTVAPSRNAGHSSDVVLSNITDSQSTDASARPSTAQTPSSLFFGPTTSKYAYVTFLAFSPTDRKEPSRSQVVQNFFDAARLLTYQLLYAPETKTHRNIPLIVVVNENVPESMRAQLREDGATVWEPEHVDPKWLTTHVAHWRWVLQKLRMFELIQFERVCFVDGDTVLTGPLDDVFEDPAVKELTPTRGYENQTKDDEGAMPSHYVFAAWPEMHRDHHYPSTEEDFARPDYTNAGFFVARPDMQLANYYYSLLETPGRFPAGGMEQELWNYAHRLEGNMPWKRVDKTWSVHYPNGEDLEGGVIALHGRWWEPVHKELSPFFLSRYNQMVGYFQARQDLAG